MLEDNAVFFNDDIAFLNADSENVTVFSGDMSLVNVNLSNVSLDDDNFDNDGFDNNDRRLFMLNLA